MKAETFADFRKAVLFLDAVDGAVVVAQGCVGLVTRHQWLELQRQLG